MTTITLPHTQTELESDLRRLGLTAGDLCFVHSSFKSLGEIDGGAEDLVHTFERVLGPDGLLLMPTFHLVDGDRTEGWDVNTTPSTVGWFTEAFRRMTGTHRSDHFSHSVSARGKDARAFVADHHLCTGMESPWDVEGWGYAYGEGMPMIKALAHSHAKVLMLGVDYHTSTYCHVIEVRDWNRRRLDNPDAEFFYINREKWGESWDKSGKVNFSKVGDADCRLFSMKDYVESLEQAIRETPSEFYKWYNPETA